MATNPLYNDELTTAADSVYLRFRDALVHGRFAPGSRLSERYLSEEYNVSRTPVREAILRLQADGLVATVAGSLVVRTITRKEARDVYRTRASLEALAAEMAAEQVREGQVAPATIDNLRARTDSVDEAARRGDPRLASLENLRLHKAIADISDNGFVIEALGRLWDRIAVSSLSNLTDPAWSAEVHVHHVDIVDAVAAGEPERAASLMRTHILRAVEVYDVFHDQSHPETPRTE